MSLRTNMGRASTKYFDPKLSAAKSEVLLDDNEIAANRNRKGLIEKGPGIVEKAAHECEEIDSLSALNRPLRSKKNQSASNSKSSLIIKSNPLIQRNSSLNEFHLLAVLSKHEMGKTMLAESKMTGKHYAIKIIPRSPDIQSQAYSSADHNPFFLNLHSVFHTDKKSFFVMELVWGGSLVSHIEHMEFNTKQAKFYACQTLLALDIWHQRNKECVNSSSTVQKIECMISKFKMENILLTVDGNLKIADFGLCDDSKHSPTTISAILYVNMSLI